jgi:hypothetical protein
MYPFTQNSILGCAAAGAVVLSLASAPAFAEELSYLGPVGPNEAILTTVGSKRVIAFYEPDGDHCGMHIVVWDRADDSGDSAARVRVTLDPRQTIHIDSTANKSLNLQCGEHAGTLAIVDNSKVMAGAAH